MADPFRMYLVLRRGAFAALEPAGVLAGAAAVACVRGFSGDERFAAAFAAWHERPGKVTLRARGGQWDEALAGAHAAAGEGEQQVVAFPPMRRSERPEVLVRMQAMTSALELPGPDVPADTDDDALVYAINPRLEMSSGKTLAQIAHAAVMAAGGGAAEGWVAAGCPARVIVPPRAVFEAWCDGEGLAARVVDAGLTEVAPGTVTVLALPAGAARSR